MPKPPTKAELQARVRAAQVQDAANAEARAQRAAQRKREQEEALAGPLESDLRAVLPEEDDGREMVLSDGRAVRINPIKMRAIPRWTGLFLQLASLNEAPKAGADALSVDITPEKMQKLAVLAPELGDLFLNLMASCLDGATPDDVDQDDAFDIIGKFISLNLTAAFMGKVMALASMRG